MCCHLSSVKIISHPLLWLWLEAEVHEPPSTVLSVDEGESPAGQYLRPAWGTLDLLSPLFIVEGWLWKKWRIEEKEGKGVWFASLPTFKTFSLILSASRPHRFRAFSPLWSKLWDVRLAQLEGSLTANSWGVGCEPSYCSWEDGSRFSIWVISAAKCAPSVVTLAADTAGEKTGAQQILNRDLKADSLLGRGGCSAGVAYGA